MVSWSDINTMPEGWEIELVGRGDTPKGIPTLPMQITKSIVINGLIPSASYDLYIRTVCGNGRSKWNVAIPFTTVIEVPTACQINIPLKDNGTEILDLYIPALKQIKNPVLGVNIFLKSVELMLEHAWPADLKIILESPQGQQLVLSNNNGTVTRNFGRIQDTTCSQFTTFSMDGCRSLKDSKPPFIGFFHPDGDINSWKPDTLSNGAWKLITIDRAVKDAGILRYLNISFSEESCIIPENFVVQKADLNTIKLGWDYKSPCNTVSILVYENDIVIDTFYIPCKDKQFTISNLKPNTEYGFSISSLCSHSHSSSDGCLIYASTSCEPVSVSENFDNYPSCEESCLASCSNTGKLWFNSPETHGQNWILKQGATQTDYTGPDGDVKGNGKYLYIENNPQLCGVENKAVLQSTCMQIESNPSGCDMSFYYHMYGIDIKLLKLEISIDGGNTWQNLFFEQGNQGNKWVKHTVSLHEYDGQLGIFRFIGVSGDGPLADIAIDQIEFYKSVPAKEQLTYYKDDDGDGYGSDTEFINICASQAPTGYVRLSGDCDDTNPDINPGAVEIQCNGIDENCNGNNDDQPQSNPIIVKADIRSSSCNGSKDGQIKLDILGGSPPYILQWNNGMSGEIISNLSPGIYYATITDLGGCVFNTAFYTIQSSNTLNIIVSKIEAPTCLGKSDGTIEISHSSDHPPYQYIWSSGDTSKHLLNAREGLYSVKVMDANGCFSIMQDIKLVSKPSVIAGIQSRSAPSCHGSKDGKLELFAVNGTAPYRYSWSTGETNNVINHLAAGNYTCTVTDINGCEFILNSEIREPDALNIQVTSTEAVRCYGEKNGSIQTNISGGTPGYTYLWNDFNYTTDDIFDIKAGIYTLTVTDANACTMVSVPIHINQPSQLVAVVDSIMPATCISGNDGSIHLNSSGGNGKYFFVWNEQGSMSNTLTDIPRGHYNVTVYDQLGCKTGIPDIEVPYVNTPIQITLNQLKDNHCFKESNAVIGSVITNGTPEYDYNWSHGLQYFKSSLQDTIIGLKAGKYVLTITDHNGCTGVSNPIVINEKSEFIYTVSTIKNNVCWYDSTGLIAVEIQGGKQPYNVVWNDGLFNGYEINDLPNGRYFGYIQDRLNCLIIIDTLRVYSISNMQIEADITPQSVGTSNGAICINVMNGAPPYQYKWSSGNSGKKCINQLIAGNYEVTVTDGLGCMITGAYVVDMMSSVMEQSETDIVVFPNPITDHLNIVSQVPITAFEMVTISGIIIRKETIAGDSSILKIDLQHYPSGFYMLILYEHGKRHTFKLVKL